MAVVATASSLVLAAFLHAAPAPAGLPFPAPRIVQVTEQLKCDFGTVIEVDAARGRMTGSTRAGNITYLVGPDAQVFSKDGHPAGGIAAVRAGSRYRAYYVLDGGAKVLEIDLE
jgi:hypothetical protein